MIWKTLIVTIILVAFVMLALGVKLLFDKNATFTNHSCASGDGTSDSKLGCSVCDINDNENCHDKVN